MNRRLRLRQVVQPLLIILTSPPEQQLPHSRQKTNLPLLRIHSDGLVFIPRLLLYNSTVCGGCGSDCLRRIVVCHGIEKRKDVDRRFVAIWINVE